MHEILNKFEAEDGLSLAYRRWTPEVIDSKKVVVIVHRGHEHSGRVRHISSELGLPDHQFFAMDARGHGESEGSRGFCPNVATAVSDLDSFVKHIGAAYGIESKDIIIIAQSLGAVTVSTWVHDYAPNLKGIVLAAPAFKVKLYIPFSLQVLKAVQMVSSKERYVSSYVSGSMLTNDVSRSSEYDSSPSIVKRISVSMLVDVFNTSKRIVSDAHAIEVPVLVLISEKDYVVDRHMQESFFNALSSSFKKIVTIKGAKHDTLGDVSRGEAFDEIRKFVFNVSDDSFFRTDRNISVINCRSFIEERKLSNPPSLLMSWIFNLQSIFLKAGSYLSDALKIGEDTGYDSGSMLDFVYNNKATSSSIMGRIIDRVYLNAIGWRGIRIRKLNIEKALQYVKSEIGYTNKIRLADIAAGQAKYIMDYVSNNKESVQEALLGDYSDINVNQGNISAKQRAISDIVKFKPNNAFAPKDVKALCSNKNVAVVSGLYELYSDNDLISKSLKAIYEGIDSGGFLIYTNQPWHPQLEFIARVLTSHKGKDVKWVMRRRSQLEMDVLVENSGFIKQQQYIDPFGIFTVSIARKP